MSFKKISLKGVMGFCGGERGDIMPVFAIVLTIMLSALTFMMANYVDISTRTIDQYKAIRNKQQISSLRNLLIDDGVEHDGEIRSPDSGGKLPAAVVGGAYPAPVVDSWGTELLYCTYPTSPPIQNLVARITSSGKNKLLETACSATSSGGDDLVDNIFVGDVKKLFLMGGTGKNEPLPDTVTRIEASGSDTSFMLYGSRLISWGKNNYGQAGIGTYQYGPKTPEFVIAGNGSDFFQVKEVAASENHALAIDENGDLWGWGLNNYGQINDGAYTQELPGRVKGEFDIGFLSDIIGIAAGYRHSLALKSNGTVLAWGLNAQYQFGLGINRPTMRSYPAAVPGLPPITAISAGLYTCMALDGDGNVWDWGAFYGYTAQMVPGLPRIKAISAGGYFSLALADDGTVWAWGRNKYGGLGDGTFTDRSTPVQVAGLTNVVAVAGGLWHSIALKADGTLMAWGLNTAGQLGDGTIIIRWLPVPLSLSGITAISAGQYHTFAVAAPAVGTPAIYAWGYNLYGQLGNDSYSSTLYPVKLSLPVLEYFGSGLVY